VLVHHAAADNPISVVVFHDPHESKSLQLSLCFSAAQGAKEIMPCGNISFPPVLIEAEAEGEFLFRPLNKLAAAKTHRRPTHSRDQRANYFGVMPDYSRDTA
jgi:hypothetical protein